MRARALKLALLILAFYGGGGGAAAAPIRVVLLDVAPYTMVTSDQRIAGIYAGIARQIAQLAGMDAEVSLVPFARVALSLGGGRADLTLGFSTDALNAAGHSLGTVMTIDSLLVTAAKHRAIGKLDELAGRTVGRLRGGCQDLERQGAMPVQFYELSSFAAGLRMLALGRLDAICGVTSDALEFYAREADVKLEELGGKLVVNKRAVHLYVRRDLDEETRARLAEALSRYRQSLPQQPRR